MSTNDTQPQTKKIPTKLVGLGVGALIFFGIGLGLMIYYWDLLAGIYQETFFLLGLLPSLLVVLIVICRWGQVSRQQIEAQMKFQEENE